jgi:hypothetical protein
MNSFDGKPVLGGKARSIPFIGSGTGGRRDLPGELPYGAGGNVSG